MSLTVKTGDVTKGRKDVDPHGRFRDEWVKKLVLEILLAAFLKKRMATLVTTEKRLQVLKIFKGKTNVHCNYSMCKWIQLQLFKKFIWL